MISAAISILRRAGIVVTSGTASDWILRLPDGTHHSVEVKTFRRNPSLGWLRHEQAAHPERRILLVINIASQQLEEYARQNFIDVVNLQSGAVIIDDQEWAAPALAEVPQRLAKQAWGRWGVNACAVSSQVPRTQTELAGFVGKLTAGCTLNLRELANVPNVR